MHQKGFSNVLGIILIIVIIGGIVGYFGFSRNKEPASAGAGIPVANNPQNTQVAQAQVLASRVSTQTPETPFLSRDKKSIITDNEILLVIDDDAIFNFFKKNSQLCDGYNLTSTPDRKMFCENKASFKKATRFASMVVSSDKTKIGFEIESDTLSPDKVIGIFYPYRLKNKINLLTNYYIGNEFISFSPNDTYFVYQSGCFEGLCGLFIKNSETLVSKIDFNNSTEGLDVKSKNAEFIRWLSDNKIEYKIGSELKQASF